MNKQTGGTRNYNHRTKTLAKRKKEFDTLMNNGKYDINRSVFDSSGGFVATHKNHNLIKDREKDKSDIAVASLAKKGYKVYLDDERSYIEGLPTPDGRLYKATMEIKTINSAGNNTIKNRLEDCAKQGATVAVLYQNIKYMTRKYVENQINLFKTNSPKRATDKIEYVIIVGLSGRVHRHKLK